MGNIVEKITALHSSLLELEEQLTLQNFLYKQIDEVERKLLEMEHALSVEQENPNKLTSRGLHKTNAVLMLQKEKRRLDQRMDLLEDLEEEIVEKTRNELTENLLLYFENEAPFYEELHEEYEKYQSVHKYLKGLLVLSKELLASLATAMNTRRRVKKRGLVSFIFGRNPNTDVIELLQLAEKENKSLTAYIQQENIQLFEYPSIGESLDKLNALLQNFSVSYDKVWTGKEFDKNLNATTQELFDIQESLVRDNQALESSIQESRKKIAMWVQEKVEQLPSSL
jgi:hypothetical protein